MSVLNILGWALDMDYLNSSSLDATLQQPFEGDERESWLYSLLAFNLKKIFIFLFWNSLKLISWKNSTESSWTIVSSNNNVLHKSSTLSRPGVSIGTILLTHLCVCVCMCLCASVCFCEICEMQHRFRGHHNQDAELFHHHEETPSCYIIHSPTLTPGDFESLLSHCDFIPSYKWSHAACNPWDWLSHSAYPKAPSRLAMSRGCHFLHPLLKWELLEQCPDQRVQISTHLLSSSAILDWGPSSRSAVGQPGI